MNKGPMGLEQHEGWVINYTIFIFRWTVTLNTVYEYVIN